MPIFNTAIPSQLITTSSLQMSWSENPWDQNVCGYPVLQINDIKILGPNADVDMQIFEQARDRLSVELISCRLPHHCIRESILLEDHGFRFIEMNFAPEISLSALTQENISCHLEVARACEDDMPTLSDIACTAFCNERFKIDPRLDSCISDHRYQNWVASSFHHPTQELYVISDGENRVAFFITELLNDGTVYWHLNAVAPSSQGKGYGRRAWLSMLQQAANVGARTVRTSITARNHRVLNLYAGLGFYFPPPSMTFHWIK